MVYALALYMVFNTLVILKLQLYTVKQVFLKYRNYEYRAILWHETKLRLLWVISLLLAPIKVCIKPCACCCHVEKEKTI